MADELKIECRPVGDEMYVESEHGYMLANLYRTAKREDGETVVLVEDDCGFDPSRNLTSDEEWRGICDLFAAAPEMLAVLKEIDRYLDAPLNYTDQGRRGIVRAVAAVIAKAGPSRKAKVRVTFEVEVERHENDFQTTARARDEVLVCGGGRVVKEEIVEG